MDELKEILGTPVMYYTSVAKITKSINSAIFLNQLLYWWEKRSNGLLYKTVKEIEKETFLTRYQQENAVNRLLELGFIELFIIGIPPKRHFGLNIEIIKSALEKAVSEKKSNTLEIPETKSDKTTNQLVEKPPIDTMETNQSIGGKLTNCYVENSPYVRGKTSVIYGGKLTLYKGENWRIYTKNTSKITTKNTTENTSIICGEKNSPEKPIIFLSSFKNQKKENNPPFLRSAPLEKEKKEKVPKSGFSETTKKMKAGFLEFYLVKKGLPYYWLGKDAKNIIEVEKKISFMLAEMQKIPDSESVIINFRTMLENISDQWILDNLSISIINMKFNEIVSKIKNRNNERNNDFGRKRISPGYERDLFRRLHGEQVQ